MSDLIGGYYYLGTPYTLYPSGIQSAFEDAARIAGILTHMGLIVYSPIVHSHVISEYSNIDPKDHALWMALDRPLVNAARGLIVVMLSGWESSRGLTLERDLFKAAGKPIFYLDPMDLPTDLIKQFEPSQQNVVRIMDIPRTTSTEPTG